MKGFHLLATDEQVKCKPSSLAAFFPKACSNGRLKQRLVASLLLSSIPITFAFALPSQPHICLSHFTPEQAYLSLTANTDGTKHETGTSPDATRTMVTAMPNTTLVNINQASEAQLAQLDGIGAKKAQDIILYRQMIAPFHSVDELANVKGIGKATVDKNRSRLTVR